MKIHVIDQKIINMQKNIKKLNPYYDLHFWTIYDIYTFDSQKYTIYINDKN